MITFERLLYKLEIQVKKKYPKSQFVQDYDAWHNMRHMSVVEVFPSLEDTESLLMELDENFEGFKWHDSCLSYMAICIDDFIEYIEENKNS